MILSRSKPAIVTSANADGTSSGNQVLSNLWILYIFTKLNCHNFCSVWLEGKPSVVMTNNRSFVPTTIQQIVINKCLPLNPDAFGNGLRCSYVKNSA